MVWFAYFMDILYLLFFPTQVHSSHLCPNTSINVGTSPRNAEGGKGGWRVVWLHSGGGN